MKNFDSDEQTRDNEQPTDVLIDKRGQNRQENKQQLLTKKTNGFKISMGQNGYGYKNLSTLSNISQDVPSHSLPECVNKNYFHDTLENNSTEIFHDDSPGAASTELWFKTWPECCDKLKSSNSSPNHTQSNIHDSNDNKNIKNTLTFSEALQNISLAYSPVTKQLHLVEKPEISDRSAEEKDECENEESKTEKIGVKKLGHRRTEAGSFSSTVSTLSGISEPSTSGSLLGSDDQSLSSFDISNSKPRKKSITNFFSK
ncbi:hypothetical protein JTB14_027806 [Gonioctena quinquepunctata]|nr:hypothetical protein JTB14_027806 [Gonioctena quinquepunctata]